MNTTLPYVYKLVHKVTGQFYIGYREANVLPAHLDLPKYKTSSRVVKRMGFENFRVEFITEFQTGEEAYIYEQQLIAENFTSTLLLNKQHRSGAKAHFRSYGQQTEEHLQKRIEAKRGTKVSEQGRANITAAVRGRKFSDEARANMSAAATGKKKSHDHVKNQAAATAKNWIVTSPSGEVLHVTNLKEFCRQNGLDQGNMQHVAAGRAKSHKGYTCSKT